MVGLAATKKVMNLKQERSQEALQKPDANRKDLLTKEDNKLVGIIN